MEIEVFVLILEKKEKKKVFIMLYSLNKKIITTTYFNF